MKKEDCYDICFNCGVGPRCYCGECQTEWFHVTEAEYLKIKRLGVKKAKPKKRKKKK